MGTRDQRDPLRTQDEMACGDSKGPLPTASLAQETEQLVYYHELQTQQKEAQLDRMLGHAGSRHAPDQAVLDGRGPLLAQMQAGCRLTSWRGLAGK